ncbi:HlyD family efflux transporter periplasmic adaptor subunit [Coralloluteibacterium stylophorae]|uniref:HlyD family efflux transporter periplasmic adaptor subunit n=1 Tax=Coralloluteibacterium stylophorae TaxID=1776034 RepID=A0A8J7VT03_9GAMM|nr:HlyD family efflux transporter periplasmic adaptor subunit [Coralloluteibacterium stylophorae]MBS7456365.1 HlyD family efflux transporter periplasmic adaptor subunit [Coralloluteibacterium stylophorae]
MTTEANTSNPTSPKPGGRRRLFLRLLGLVLVVAAIAAAAWYLLVARWHEETDDAYVQGNVVQITPMVGGTVVGIDAEDGMLVHAGQRLVQLDPADTEIALEQAEANLARTVRQVRGLYRNVGGAQADVDTRRVTLSRARADYERRRALVETGAISAEELAHARDALAAAEAALSASSEQLEVSQALVEDTEVRSHPDVMAAAAQVRQAWLAHERSEILAPVTGYVAQRAVQLGQRVQPGATLMAVVPLDEVWVDANFKETQLEKMRLGQPVTLHADLYGDDVAYRGTVESLGLGTGSAFSLLPAQNASGNWIKIVQRIPVRIALDPETLEAHPLRIGLSMNVEVDLHGEGRGVLPTQPASEPVLTTDIYARQRHEADARAQSIIDQNLPSGDGESVAAATR